MKTSNTGAKKFGSTISKILMALVLVSMIGSMFLAPAFAWRGGHGGHGGYGGYGHRHGWHGGYYGGPYYDPGPYYAPPPFVILPPIPPVPFFFPFRHRR